MNKRLTIDGAYIGYVKRYYQNRDHQSWVFVLDTIDSASEKYQLQVEIKFSAIRYFSSSDGLDILTQESAPSAPDSSRWNLADMLYVPERGEIITIAEFIADHEKLKESGQVLGDWESDLEYSIKHGILERIKDHRNQ